MKDLILIRHAKSSWKHDLPDEDRPLNGRGRRDAPAMAVRLSEAGPAPDLILTSPALRALRTAQAVHEVFPAGVCDLMVDARIYEAGSRGLMDIVTGLPDVWARVVLVGHNPDMTLVAETLSGKQIGNLPTSGVVRMTWNVDHWTAVGSTAPASVWMDFPKMHR